MSNKNKFDLGELLIPAIFILFYIIIRSIYFADSLNFSTDQANFSLRALEIWKNKEVTLIGPAISLQLNGREIFQGGAIYYFQLLFLLIGSFDPLKASYAFMIFSALSIIPLYFGMKWLSNKAAALTLIIIYTLFPLFIIHTKFLWNPNFQLALLPYSIFFLGLYARSKSTGYLFITGLTLGFITQFHYQGVIVILLSLIILKNIHLTWKDALILLVGIIFGLGNLILFELRNQFYNTKTFFLYLQNFFSFSQKNSGSILKNPHYFLSILLMIYVLVLFFFKNRINRETNILIFAGLSILSLSIFIQKPVQGYGMAKDWYYHDEVKVYELIRSNNIKDFNIANLIYDTKAAVQKYLHKKDDIAFDTENY